MNTDITKIRDILMAANAIHCDVVDLEPEKWADSSIFYKIPTEYTVTIDFNKMANAIYNAGYRFSSDTDNNGEESKND